MKVLGIDPGKTGGLALADGGKMVKMEVMPEDSFFLINLLVDWSPDIVYLEKAQAMPGNGGVSMFTYAQGYGEIIGILKSLKIPYVLVRPTAWTKILHKGQSGKDAKVKSRSAALSLFPYMNFLATARSRKPHEGLVDAALIAEYGSREEYNKGRMLLTRKETAC